MIKSYLKFLESKKHLGSDYSYGCVMVSLSIPNWNEILEHIDIRDLYKPEENRYGLETEPHITILYGLHETVSDAEVEDIVMSYKGSEITIDVTGIEVFECDEYDVVKMSVFSQKISQMHYDMEKLPNSDKHPQYKPHITIAYVKKGTGKKYEKLEYNHHIKGISTITYSKPDGSKIEWAI